MNKKKELVKNTVIIFLGKVCTQFISFLLLPLYTAYLATTEYGIVDLIHTYVQLLVPVVTLQLDMAVFRFLVDARGKKDETNKVVTNCFINLITLTFIFVISYLVLTRFINIKYGLLVFLNMFACIFSSNMLQAARGVGRVSDFSIGSVVSGVTTIILNVLLIVVFKMGPRGMLIASAVANFFCALYLIFRLKIYKNINFKYKDKDLQKKLLKYSLPLVPNGVSWWIVNVSDRTIITYFINVGANGIYSVACKFPTIFSSILTIFSLSWSESASLHINDKDRDEFFSETFNQTIKFFTCIALGIIACLPFVFNILINVKYADSYNYIPILLVSSVFNMMVLLQSGIYIAKKLTKKVASTSIYAAIINIIINLLFIGKFKIYAACYSTVIAYGVIAIFRHFDIKKYVDIKYEKGLLIKTILMFIMVIYLYYLNNLVGNIISLTVTVIYAYILNKNFLFKILDSVLNKLNLKKVKIDEKNI